MTADSGAAEAVPEDAPPNLDRIDAEPEPLTLSNGMVVNVKPLQTRQFLKLLRILTHGGGPFMSMLMEARNGPPGDFVGVLLGALLYSIPDAEEETIQFIKSCIAATDEPVPNVALSQPELKMWHTANQIRRAELDIYLDNPDMEDTLGIIEHIINTEGADIEALGKRLVRMMGVAEKVGETKPRAETPQTPLASSQGGPESLTPSAVSTGGRTNKSSRRTSGASAK